MTDEKPKALKAKVGGQAHLRPDGRLFVITGVKGQSVTMMRLNEAGDPHEVTVPAATLTIIDEGEPLPEVEEGEAAT